MLLVQNPTSGFPADFYDSLTGPATFGPGGSVTGDSGTGLGFGWSATDGAVVVPDGYISGDPISGSLTFSSTTLTALGVTPGTYVWSLPNDSITLNVGTVPIPAAGWLMSSGLVGLAGLGRYRKKA